MKKLLTLILTLTLGLVSFALSETKVMDQARTNMLNTGRGRFTQPGPPQGPCTPRPSGLVAWWPLDEQTGTTVNDIAGGHNGVFKPGAIGGGGPTSVAGSYVGNSLQFPWNARAEVPNTQDLNFGSGNFTIDAWVKYLPPSPASGTIVEKRDMSQNGYVLRILTPYPSTTQAKLQLLIGNTAYTGPDITAPAGTWFFVAAVRNGATVTLYVDNNSLPLTTPTSWQASSTYPLWIGFSSGGGSSVKLAIDEVEIFNRALSQPELQSIYAARSAGKCKEEKKGMTWFHTASNAQYGTITVGCGPAGPNRCDTNKGDTLCTQQLPVLCIYKPTPAFQKPVGLPEPDRNNRWSGGVVATTPPVAGSTFANSAAVNAYCQAQFGPGWRVAEFHDGWGWNFQAYGGTVSAPTVPSTRFWVHINTTKANCWEQ